MSESNESRRRLPDSFSYAHSAHSIYVAGARTRYVGDQYAAPRPPAGQIDHRRNRYGDDPERPNARILPRGTGVFHP